MEYTPELQQVNDTFLRMLTEDIILSKAMFAIVCCVALPLMLFALYKKAKRQWDSLYFALISAAVLVWAACSFLAVVLPESAGMYTMLRMAGIVPIPALLCLHVRQQVSYKEPRAIPIVSLLLVPAFLLCVIFRSLLFPSSGGLTPFISETDWYDYIFYLYVAATLIRSYMLCFSVFYQMPRRTRRSTRYMLVGVSALSVMFIMTVLWSAHLSTMLPQSDAIEILSPLCAPVALLILLYSLFNALYVMPASEVIVTSREFVVGGLSTTILILNRKEEILDWNRTDWGNGYPLPKPLFKEPISEYRKRMLAQKTCRVSPHSDDVIIAKQDNVEKHFLLRNHEAKNSKRLFGYVLEISEVTQLYTIIRYFEQIARYDQLTGLFNRNAYIHRVEQITQGQNMPLLILVGDVNMLKRTNDMHGHMLGDELLSIVADMIRSTMPKDAFAARVGGDEFVLLVPGGSAQLAQQFIQQMKMQCAQIKHEVFGSPSVSWGYELMTSVEQKYDDVFSVADNMMYEDKKEHYRFSSSGLLHNS